MEGTWCNRDFAATCEEVDHQGCAPKLHSRSDVGRRQCPRGSSPVHGTNVKGAVRPAAMSSKRRRERRRQVMGASAKPARRLVAAGLGISVIAIAAAVAIAIGAARSAAMKTTKETAANIA